MGYRWAVVLHLLSVFAFACSNLDTDSALDGVGENADAGDTTAGLSPCEDNGNCEQMFCDQVYIDGGSFQMGADTVTTPSPGFGRIFPLGDETPIHAVSLSPYCIDKYEVTYERYLACVEDGACSPNGVEYEVDKPIPDDGALVVNHYPIYCRTEEDLKGTIDRCPHHPVNCKNYTQAREYCEWTGRRLCTEAEWERAVSGPHPERRPYPWGDEELDVFKANLGTFSTRLVERVDRFPQGTSRDGVFNLFGNVFEWVHDYYASYDKSGGGQPLHNPAGPDAGEMRVVRGGCAFEGEYITAPTRLMQVPEFDWG